MRAAVKRSSTSSRQCRRAALHVASITALRAGPAGHARRVEAVLLTAHVRGGCWVDLVMGGLNYQIEHHLFPSMPS